MYNSPIINNMLMGRQKGNYRITILNLVTGKSKTITLHITDSNIDEQVLTKIIIEALQNKE